MSVMFYGYSGCGTCRKAKKWLDENGVSFQEIPIVESPPSKVELEKLYKMSGLPIKKFFNTSGRRYRDLGMKDKINTESDDELLNWLASDGMLIKRPIVTDNDKKVTVGFSEELFEKNWR
ncbi:arsenate reductase [Pullulanibacillus camelliae]|uniref:Arsenate reductase n=1 Tax=Pullulanibacillus camelliae TaxID=1707096 RepID=A0A8J2YK88_9BACL|nr:arsenate reductase family protein [Pullulanibacillus camelliae]GGE48360.1 arsenate reductase [Pullulanibacillus camelliae]